MALPLYQAIGGPELLIVLLILAVFAVAGALVVAALFFLLRGRSETGSAERLADLEARVARLEAAADAGEEADGDDRTG